jgi:plastocyanin
MRMRLVIGAILAMVAAACGGGASGTGATTAPGSTTAPAATTGAPVATTAPANTDDANTDDPNTDTGDEFDTSISVTDFAFNPSSFTFVHDQTLGLLAQGAKSPHTFTIEELEIDEPIAPGVVATVTISGEPGTYEFICRFHAGQGMKGTVELRAP